MPLMNDISTQTYVEDGDTYYIIYDGVCVCVCVRVYGCSVDCTAFH